MKVLRELAENKGIAIALGFFDGVHIGHKKIIQTLVAKAKEKDIKTAIITFDTNPADYFNPVPTKNIQTFKDREVIFSSLGIDYLYELNFEELKDLTAEEYLENVLKKYFDPKLIVIGYNHTFGKNKEGNGAFLSQNSQKLGYELIVVPELKYNNEEVSSSQIRKRIEKGHLNAVKAFLGRNFSVRNSVVKGDKIARTLGYPTANIVWPESMVKLPYGVYWGFCQVGSKLLPSLISWGQKPTLTPGKNEVLESHIYELDEDLYGKIIKVIFIKKVRDEQNFGNIRLLAAQIKKDYDEFEAWAKTSKIH